MLVGDYHVALSGERIDGLGGLDLDTGFGARDAFEILQSLFDIAQVEDIAATRWQRVPVCAALARTGREADVAYPAWDEREHELA